MDEKEFTSKITGKVRISLDGVYPYFNPNDLPFEYEITNQITKKSVETAMNIARLDGMASCLTNLEKNCFLKAFTLKESTHSSSIEGTRSSLDDMFRYEKKLSKEKWPRDAIEVSNYKKAMEFSLEKIKSGSKITVSLLNEMHKILLTGTRGENKSPGKFKTEQNAIGTVGDTLETAKMVPAPPEAVEHLIDNLLNYSESDEDPIIKIAFIHYQFEAIHPYRDGNGRIGRLLIMLMLAKENLLNCPLIYPSEFFDGRRKEYIDRLFEVSSKDAIKEWLEFFINALNEQALVSMETLNELRTYKTSLLKTYSGAESEIAEMIFENPYVMVKDVETRCKISNPTAQKILNRMENDGVLRESTGKQRNRIYVADGVMEILSKRR